MTSSKDKKCPEHLVRHEMKENSIGVNLYDVLTSNWIYWIWPRQYSLPI